MSTEKIGIRVKVVGEDDRNSFVLLNIKDELPKIREILEYDEKIKMDNTLLFSYEETYITVKNESSFRLENIIVENNTLFLKKPSISNLDYFKYKLKLGFGRTLTPKSILIECSENEVFTMKIEECNPCDRVRGKDVNFNSKEGWSKNINMFYNAEVGMMNFGLSGLSFLHEQNTNNQTEIKCSYKFTKIPKLILKFNELKLTPKFIEEVENAHDSRKFGQIYKNFGQFVPTEVTLGGIVYHETIEVSNTRSSQRRTNVGLGMNTFGVNLQSEFTGEQTTEQSTNSRETNRILIGGKPQGLETFNEDEWIESLENRDTWECIEFRKPISVFQLLDGELREKVYKFFEKKILYRDVITRECHLEYGNKEIVRLPLSDEICETINNEKANCSVFATVVDDEEKKNDFFNCQIYHPQNEKPQLIIHCFQKKQKCSTVHKLRIAFMIVGYDIHFNLNNLNDFNDNIRLEVIEINNLELNQPIFSFNSGEVCSFLGIPVLKEVNNIGESIVIGHYFSKNGNNIEANVFSYNLRENNCANLPDLSDVSFHILTISTVSGNSKETLTYGIVPFKKKKFMKLKQYAKPEKHHKEKNSTISTSKSLNPKYISVYLVNVSCNPVFLKQKRKKIKLKHVTCNCKKPCISCEIGSDKMLKEFRCTYFVSTKSDDHFKI